MGWKFVPLQQTASATVSKDEWIALRSEEELTHGKSVIEKYKTRNLDAAFEINGTEGT